MELPAPVATQIRPPDPQAGIDTYAKILGIKQAQQNLQTGAYAQQEQAATAQQQQQTAKQRAALANWDFTKYDDGTGVIDTAQAAKDGELRKAAGDSFPSLLEQLNGMRSAQIKGKQDYLGLQGAELDTYGKIVGPFEADEDVKAGNEVGRHKLINGLSMAQEDASPEFKSFLGKRIDALRGLPLPSGPNRLLENGVKTSARQALSASEQIPSIYGSTGSIDSGAQIIPGTVAPAMEGGGFKPAGTAFNKQLGPTDQPGYKRAVAAASTEGSAGAQNDETLYNGIVQEGTKATQIKSLSQDVQHLAHEVQTGEYSKVFASKWAAIAQSLGLSPESMTTATRRQILSKMSAQLKTQAESGATTDAERGGIDAAMPDPDHMTPDAVAQAARYVGAQADVKSARMQLANVHRQIGGGVSSGLRNADSQFMQHADPRVFEYQSIPAGKERQAYLKSHFSSAAEVQDFLSKQKTLKDYGAFR